MRAGRLFEIETEKGLEEYIRFVDEHKEDKTLLDVDCSNDGYRIVFYYVEEEFLCGF